MRTCLVEFRREGEVTWVSPSGQERRGHVCRCQRMSVGLSRDSMTGHYCLWDGEWHILVPTENFRLV